MPSRIIVGPMSAYVERNGLRSKYIPLGETDTPEQVRQKARGAEKAVLPLVAFLAWEKHRFAMSRQRAHAAEIQARFKPPYFRGPRPDLIAVKPWKNARFGEWAALPHGVVGRLMQANKGEQQ